MIIFVQRLFNTIIILYISSAASIFLHSSNPDLDLSQWIPRVYSTEDGLPQNTVRTIAQTDDGYLWFGTYEGLARFDGIRFETFNNINTPEFNRNDIRVLLKDRNNRLWIGTSGDLVQYYKGRFKRFSTKDGLASDNILSLHEDSSGGLWVGTTHGLCQWREKAFVSYYLDTKGPHYHIRALCEGDDGYLWVGSEGGGLYRFKQGTFEAWPDPRGLLGKDIRALGKNKNGELWIGTAKGLVLHRQGKLYPYSQSEGLRGASVTDIHRGRKGISWITTFEGGLNRLKDGALAPLETIEGLPECLLECIFQDREGSLWLGTRQCGVYQFTKRKFLFYGKHMGLPTSPVRAIMQDRKGAVWVGTRQDGLVRIMNDRVKVYPPTPELKINWIISLGTDHDDSLWIGTYNNGLFHLKDESFSSYNTGNGLSNDIIRAIIVDRGGLLWVGSDSGGIDVLSAGKVIRHYSTENGLSDNFVYALAEDNDGDIWVGTFKGGVNRIKNNTVTVYNSSRIKGFPETIVWSIYPDPEGNIWFGTGGGGLLRFGKKENKWDVFKVSDGLFPQLAFVVLEDRLGYLWMNDNNGIYKVKKQELLDLSRGKLAKVSCIYYDREQWIRGAGSSGPAHPAGWSSRDGTLWFQNPHGFGAVKVDPGNIPVNTVEPPVNIEKVMIDQKDYSRVMEITAPPGEGYMEIHYTATSFRNPKQVLFKYRLEGFSDKWEEVGTRRTAFYTNLPPGKYTFRVIACNNDGVWNTTGANLKIKILPSFWQTGWFRSLALLFMLGLIYLFLKLRTRTIEMQKIKLKQDVQLQTKELEEAREKAETATQIKSLFLARMSHEIRTPMNAVIGFTDMLLSTDLNEEQKDFARTINRSGESLLHLIDDILDFSKIEAGQLSFESADFDPGAAVSDVSRAIQPRIAKKYVTLLCRVDQRVPALLKGDAGRFRQVVANLMTNAVKFTRQGEIQLTLEVEREESHGVMLELKVRDTGIGIDPGRLETIFNDFQQADDSISRKFGGTGLGLAICRQIARMMKGDIRVESTPGKGSAFYFTAWFEWPAEKEKKPVPIARPEAVATKGNGGSVSILLAEDNPI
ncbi:MAG: hypothetical protein GY940_30045, partial [bacterium]|nr:hypothetical protein [bacterium]